MPDPSASIASAPATLSQRFAAVVAEYLAAVDPTASKPELSFAIADGRRSTLAITLPRSFTPPATEEQERETRVITFMAKIADGERVKGQTIAAELDEEYATLRKTLAALVAREILYARQGVGGYSKGPRFPGSLI